MTYLTITWKRLCIVSFIVALYCLHPSSSAAGQDNVNTKLERFNAFQEFKNTLEAGEAVWNSNRGHMQTLSRSAISVPGSEVTDARNVAESFILQSESVLGIESSDTRLEWVSTSPPFSDGGRRIVKFRQVYKDIPVTGSGYVVGVAGKKHMGREVGDIVGMAGKLLPDINIDTTPAISMKDAEQVLRKVYGKSYISLERGPLLVIHASLNRKEADPILAYESLVRTTSDIFLVRINAKSGKLISSQHTSSGVKSATYTRASREYIQITSLEGPTPTNYLSDVSTCSTSPCGSVHPIDGSTSGTDEFQLYYLDNNDELDGSDMEMVNVDNNNSTAEAVNGDFIFGTTSWEFDQTNAYYHSTNALLDLLESPERKIQIKTHGVEVRAYPDEINPKTSDYFVLQSETSEFNNSHLASEVVVHEYWHIISMFRNEDLNDNVKNRALWEGISDFAGLLYRKKQGSSSTTIMNWYDKPGGEDYCPRNIVNTLSFADWNTSPYLTDLDGCYDVSGRGDEYDGAPIIAGALWKFYHNNSGSDLLKLSVFRSALFALAADPEIPDMFVAMRDTEECEYLDNSSHDCSGDLEAAFCSHLIEVSGELDCPGPIPKNGDADFYGVRQAPVIVNSSIVSIYPNPFVKSIGITVSINNVPSHVILNVYDTLGRKVAKLVEMTLDPGLHTVNWRGRSSKGGKMPPGVYIVEMIAGPDRSTTTIVLSK